MVHIIAKDYFTLLRDLAQCRTEQELRALERRIKDICDIEIGLSHQVQDVRKATFTVMIEKINAMYAAKLKLFSDEKAQAGLNKWTFWLMVGTFAMVVVSAISTVIIAVKK